MDRLVGENFVFDTSIRVLSYQLRNEDKHDAKIDKSLREVQQNIDGFIVTHTLVLRTWRVTRLSGPIWMTTAQEWMHRSINCKNYFASSGFREHCAPRK